MAALSRTRFLSCKVQRLNEALSPWQTDLQDLKTCNRQILCQQRVAMTATKRMHGLSGMAETGFGVSFPLTEKQKESGKIARC